MRPNIENDLFLLIFSENVSYRPVICVSSLDTDLGLIFGVEVTTDSSLLLKLVCKVSLNSEIPSAFNLMSKILYFVEDFSDSVPILYGTAMLSSPFRSESGAEATILMRLGSPFLPDFNPRFLLKIFAI